MTNTIRHKFSAQRNNENNIAGSFYRALTILCICNQQQTLNYYLKSTKTNRSAKGLSGKFIESSMASKLHSKYAQQTCVNESKVLRSKFV